MHVLWQFINIRRGKYSISFRNFPIQIPWWFCVLVCSVHFVLLPLTFISHTSIRVRNPRKYANYQGPIVCIVQLRYYLGGNIVCYKGREGLVEWFEREYFVVNFNRFYLVLEYSL